MKFKSVFWIFLLLVFTSFDVVKGFKKNYDEILKSLKYPEKLIFDLTSALKNKLENNSNFGNHGSVNQLGVRLSPILYRSRDENYPINVFSFTDQTRKPQISFWDDIPKCFLFGRQSKYGNQFYSTLPSTSKSLTAALDNTASIHDEHATVIFSFTEHNLPLLDHTTFPKSEWIGFKTGLEYHSDSFKKDLLRPIISLVDVVIVTIDIRGKFQLSYSFFKANLGAALEPTYQLVRDTNPNCTIYVKLTLASDNYLEKKYLNLKVTDDLYPKYYYYLLQYSVFWANEEDGKRGIILPTFNNSLTFQQGFEGTYYKKLFDINMHILNPTVGCGACQAKTLLDYISHEFKSAVLSYEQLELFKNNGNCILTNDSECRNNGTESALCNRPNGNAPLLSITVQHQIDETNLNDKIKNTKNLLQCLPWKHVEFFVDLHDIIDGSTFQPWQVGMDDIPDDVTISCGVNGYYGDDLGDTDNMLDFDIVTYSYQACEFVWDMVDTINWYIFFPTGPEIETSRTINIHLDIFNVNIWTVGLLRVEEKRQEFMRRFPAKQVTPRLSFEALGVGHLYCCPDNLRANAIAEVVINFGRLHNYSFFRPLRLWKNLKTVPELNLRNIGFPVSAARDYPEKFLLGDFPTDPCILWTEMVPAKGIKINSDYGGATLFMAGMKSNGSLSSGELQVMLLFALHKFSLVEIIPATISDLQAIVNVLTVQDFMEQLEVQESKPIRLYIRVKCNLFSGTENELDSLLDKLENARLKPAGIHFVNLSDCSQSVIIANAVQSIAQKSHEIKFGLSLEHCLDDVNSGFTNLKEMLHLYKIDYLVCHIERPANATNADIEDIEEQLDTTLYISKYFEKVFPSESKDMSLFFRFNTKSSSTGTRVYTVLVHGIVKTAKRDNVTDFLAFISDVNQYAAAYKSKFFISSAFDDVAGSRIGWWSILNFEDLTNSSVYIEKEAEHLGRRTWRPTSRDSEVFEHVSTARYGEFIIAMGAGVIITFLISIALFLQIRNRRRFAILTKMEVGEFRNGKSNVESGMEHQPHFENLKFPKEFEIERHGFQLENVIGRGEFGLVYNANLTIDDNERMQAAVKIPNSSCPETFKSMLSELKILCYLGKHPHVVTFLGAYINEIGAGMVYIATEFCENGSLLGYLRKLQLESECNRRLSVPQQLREDDIEDNPETVQIWNELCKFSHEISLGMEFIADRRIVHGDLSARNILLNSHLHCKIADFGLSRKLYQYEKCVKEKSEVLAWRWMAVECLKRMEFTVKSDVWSYGITLWEIFSLGSVPYPGLRWTFEFVDKLENGFRMPSPKLSSPEIYEKMMTCWSTNPQLRPSFIQLSQFFASMRDKAYIQI